ncbi:cache domain-containing sensor histidine kinase [Paenibacillus alkalitolerans]|uniref:cache domain-containing sensor histidine kinase n=1 Tax=Paenibacillus alkalitolerans TaxID=2799335 RepID=UPI0018F6F3E7|nr:histidine kinase [Paenibacillus alkalitolerans]
MVNMLPNMMLRTYRNMDIKSKLFLFLSLVMLSGLTITFSALYYVYSIYDRQLYEKSSQLLNLSSTAIEAELRKIQRMSFGILSNGEIQSTLLAIREGNADYENFQNRAALKNTLVRHITSEHYVMSLHLIDSLNKESFAAGNNISIPDGKLENIRAETHLAEGRVRWFYPDENDSAVIMAREIRSYEGLSLTPIGTLIIRINLRKLLDDLAAGSDAAGGGLRIMSGRDAIIPDNPPAQTIPSAAATSDRQTGYDIANSNGKHVFISYIRSPYTGWTYYNIVPYNSIFDKVVYMKKMLIAGFLVTFAAAAVTGMGFARSITKPIQSFTAQMKALHKGGLESIEPGGLPPVSGHMDEVGLLHRTFRMMIARIHELIQENYVKQLSIKETEFKALQAQINPHFLYNTLETINWMAQTEGHANISRVALSLGHLLRSSISLKEPLITVREEIEIVRSYLTIQKIRFEDQLEYELAVPEPAAGCLIPKLSLQPIVENSVNYALEEMMETCLIRVRAVIEDGRLLVTVDDNGPGTDPMLLEKLYSGEIRPRGSGIGLRNIDERIRLMFGESYGLTVESGFGSGTRIRLSLPVKGGNRRLSVRVR